jgi:hypothetical protein
MVGEKELVGGEEGRSLVLRLQVMEYGRETKTKNES